MGSLLCSDLKEELEDGSFTRNWTRDFRPWRSFMIGEPVASAKDLQWYKGLLLEKERELSSVQGDAGTRAPAASGERGHPSTIRRFKLRLRALCLLVLPLLCEYSREKR